MKYKRLDQRLQEIQRFNEMTFREFSERTGLGHTVLTEATNHNRPLSLNSIGKIAKGFDLYPVQFFDDELLCPESLNLPREYVFGVLNSYDPSTASKINSGRLNNHRIDEVCLANDITPVYLMPTEIPTPFQVYKDFLCEIIDNPTPENLEMAKRVMTDDLPMLRLLAKGVYEQYFDLINI